MIDEIPIPDRVEDGSVEIVRIISLPNGNNVFLILHGTFDDPDPGLWGLIAVDLLRHAARGVENMELKKDGKIQTHGEILARMKEIFDAEWERPTAPAERMTDA